MTTDKISDFSHSRKLSPPYHFTITLLVWLLSSIFCIIQKGSSSGGKIPSKLPTFSFFISKSYLSFYSPLIQNLFSLKHGPHPSWAIGLTFKSKGNFCGWSILLQERNWAGLQTSHQSWNSSCFFYSELSYCIWFRKWAGEKKNHVWLVQIPPINIVNLIQVKHGCKVPGKYMMHKTGLPENNSTVNCTFACNEAIYKLHNEASHAHIEPLRSVPNLWLLLHFSWFPYFPHNSLVFHFKNVIFSTKLMKVMKNIAISIYCEQTEFFILSFQSYRITAGSSFQDPQILKLRAPIRDLVW